MPIYEYRCSACRHELESIQKFSDAPLVACPQCGKDTLVKLVSAGSGWYQTDVRGSGSKPAAKPDAAAGTEKAADGAKTESAPAATAEATPAKSDAKASTPSTSSTPPAST